MSLPDAGGRVAWLRAAMAWSPVYDPAWDAAPEEYLRRGIVGFGRSRRLGRLRLAGRGIVAYAGVQHVDPARWGMGGAPASRFFVSCRAPGQVWLRTSGSMDGALRLLAQAIGGALENGA